MRHLALLYTGRGEMPHWVCSAGAGSRSVTGSCSAAGANADGRRSANKMGSAGAAGSRASSAPAPPPQAAKAPPQAPPPTPAGPGTLPPPGLMQSGTRYIEEQLGSRWRMWLRCVDCVFTGGPFDGKGSDPYDAARAQGWTKALTKSWNNSPCCRSCSQVRGRA